MNPQRDISLSRWQGDKENFSLRVDPPLQFCSKLLHIYYKLRGIIWLNESEISPCQQDVKNFFFEGIPPSWIGSVRIFFVFLNEKIQQQEEEI